MCSESPSRPRASNHASRSKASFMAFLLLGHSFGVEAHVHIRVCTCFYMRAPMNGLRLASNIFLNVSADYF